ncbi:cupin domain-containing protein [Pelagibacterium luteolum]|uniref:Cupin domain-containing protein n=1 Tax=Pelagibacterium luteolum TaxID=440168 RepID=A0A1G7U2D6_9HYPH|nr:cupin domain-containing protein [Pelagibacterium luteolum]SDG41716.1 Cupin domain-containing protein [Pelagibacterium luteolum]
MPHHFLPAADRPTDAPRTIKFEGGPYGTAISFFAVISPPGKRVGLHVHPYTETWIVQEGMVRFHAGPETVEAGVGDIMVVPPETPHGFEVMGDRDLKMMCIHDAGEMTQTFLDPADA